MGVILRVMRNVMNVIVVATFLVVVLVGCSSRGKKHAPVPAPLAIVTDVLPDAAIDEPYSLWLEATGGVLPYNWSIDAGDLPDGLTLLDNGFLSGTPSKAGMFDFTVKVQDNAGNTDAKSLSLTVIGPLTISTDSLPEGIVGVGYDQSLEATGGSPPYTWLLLSGTLPDWLLLGDDGTILGTPSVAGDFTFVVEVQDDNGDTASKEFSITISASSFEEWVDTFADESKVGTKDKVVVTGGRACLEADASATEELDQSNETGSGYVMHSYVGQTFTAGMSGKLTMVSVECGDSGNVTLELSGGGVSASATTNITDDGWHDFVFDTPPDITAGTQYTFILYPDSGTIKVFYNGNDSSYTGGQIITPPGITISGDVLFKTYVMQFTQFVSDTGTITSVEIEPSSVTEWGEFSFTEDEPAAASTDIKYTVEAWNSDASAWETPTLTDADGSANGEFDDSPVDLSGLDASVYTKLRLSATLTTTDVTNPEGPTIDEWKVTYKP